MAGVRPIHSTTCACLSSSPLERGVTQEETISGVEIGSMLDLLNWVLESDKALFA